MQGVYPQADGTVLVDGAVPVSVLNDEMAWALPEEQAATIAGLLIYETDAIPEPGQVFAFHDFRFQVMHKDRNRLTTLKMTPPTNCGRPDDRR